MARVRDILLRDTRANQPLPAEVDIGVLYYVTDEGVTEQNNGTTWDSYTDTGGSATDVDVSTTAANSFLTMGA